MKIIPAFVVSLLIGSVLTACGDNKVKDAEAVKEAARIQAYCAAVKGPAAEIRSFNKDDPNYGKLPSYFDEMHKLAKKSPTSLRPAWNVVDFDFTEIEKAVDAANITFASIPRVIKGKLPKGAKPRRFPDLASAFKYLTSANLATSLSAIEDHAKKVCDVNLTPKSG